MIYDSCCFCWVAVAGTLTCRALFNWPCEGLRWSAACLVALFCHQTRVHLQLLFEYTSTTTKL
jgi:hypothetical protein